MRASIEQRIAGGVGAASGRVHIEKGDTMWSFANRVLDAAVFVPPGSSRPAGPWWSPSTRR